mgnify:CR=1 FL=1
MGFREMKLLILSNGHGEDAIAAQIAEKLQLISNLSELAFLPLVGEGHAYRGLNIPLIGRVKKMPSGGFVYMDGRELWRDLQGGLLQLTLAQFQSIRQWGQEGGKILAVGDILPLIFAWISGAEYAFVGTAKSEYYLRDENSWLASTSFLERSLGSDYFPWERWLMTRQKCKAVFPRDTLTSQNLKQFSIPTFDLGNPMMDGLQVTTKPVLTQPKTLTILLLPGSRSPEAERNWRLISQAINEILQQFRDQEICFLAAIAPSLALDSFKSLLIEQQWQTISLNSVDIPIHDPQAIGFQKGNAKLFLSQHAYGDCLHFSDMAIAMAGTATEQFVGLGKPVFSLPGTGPQFTSNFAKRQTYLLGESVILVNNLAEIGHELNSVLNSPETRQAIAENGKKRLGQPGAAARIANCLRDIWE